VERESAQPAEQSQNTVNLWALDRPLNAGEYIVERLTFSAAPTIQGATANRRKGYLIRSTKTGMEKIENWVSDV
jgi:hypothetical protein